MKTKIMHRKIHAYHTGDPGEVLRLMKEAEAVTLPDQLYFIGNDIVDTVDANTPERDRAGAAAAYLLRVAYILQREGRFVEAPPKPPRIKKKPEAGTTK